MRQDIGQDSENVTLFRTAYVAQTLERVFSWIVGAQSAQAGQAEAEAKATIIYSLDWGDKTTQGLSTKSTESNDLKFMIPKMYPYKIL